MVESNKIEGFATITSIGTTATGGPHETPIARLTLKGTEAQYSWISEKIDWLELKVGQEVHVRAFVRPNGQRIYRVTVTK